MALIDIQERMVQKDDWAFPALSSTWSSGLRAGRMVNFIHRALLFTWCCCRHGHQWAVNQGSCVINNIETWLRTGRGATTNTGKTAGSWS